MPEVVCRECGARISKRDTACPHCGASRSDALSDHGGLLNAEQKELPYEEDREEAVSDEVEESESRR